MKREVASTLIRDAVGWKLTTRKEYFERKVTFVSIIKDYKLPFSYKNIL